MQRLMCLFLVAAGLWSCDQNTQPTASRLDGPKLMYTVDAVILERPDDGGAIVLRASGTVRSSGWTNARLEAAANPSSGGIIAYRFMAMPPAKNTNVAQALQPVEATLRISAVPPDVKTIRVIAETNWTETTLPVDEAVAAPGGQTADGVPDDAMLPDTTTEPPVQPQR